MQHNYLAQAEDGTVYDVVVSEEGYIIGYSKNLFALIPDKKPDYVDMYFQIPESLPSRFKAWII